MLKSEEHTAAGGFTFNVPAGVTGVRVTMLGGGASGGAGLTSSTGEGGGGGSGELVVDMPYVVTGGGTVSCTVGAGGAAPVATNPVLTVGEDSSFGTLIARGGKAGAGGQAGSDGGGSRGGLRGTAPTNPGAMGSREGPGHFGGSGGGGARTAGTGGGGGAAGYPIGGQADSAGGGGGASSLLGVGAAGGADDAAGATATISGTGGGGGGGKLTHDNKGGDGAPGYILIVWCDNN